MSDPRLSLYWDGQNAKYITCPIDNSTITYSATTAHGSTLVGRAVTYTSAGDGTIELVADGGFVLGRLAEVTHDNYATVQVGGVMRLPPGAAATLTEGKAIVGAASAVPANGYIREVATATAAELGVCRGFVIEDGAGSDGNHAVYL